MLLKARGKHRVGLVLAAAAAAIDMTRGATRQAPMGTAPQVAESMIAGCFLGPNWGEKGVVVKVKIYIMACQAGDNNVC